MKQPAVVLLVSQPLLQALRDCAAAAYPEECCGLLVGFDENAGLLPGVVGKRVSRVLPTANRAAMPNRAFEIDPAAHIALLRELRERARGGQGSGEQMLGHYHSHPDSFPVPSAQDRAQAMEPGALWVIIAAGRDGAGEIRAWQAIGEVGGLLDFQAVELVSSE
jgi:proteasome lid subunit RPN8/RPN11